VGHRLLTPLSDRGKVLIGYFREKQGVEARRRKKREKTVLKLIFRGEGDLPFGGE